MNKLEMKEHGTAGTLITFCGLDGCGKTTMIRMLTDALEANGTKLLLTKQPTDAVRTSNIFRTYTDTPNHDRYDYRSLSLFAACYRVQHVNKVILPALKAGKTVICDRYFYSCLANLLARGYLQDEWIYDVAKYIIKPDLAFFLDVPVETALKRVRAREEEKDKYIDITLQYRLRQYYRDIAEKNEGILLSTTESEKMTYSKIVAALGKIGRKNNDR